MSIEAKNQPNPEEIQQLLETHPANMKDYLVMVITFGNIPSRVFVYIVNSTVRTAYWINPSEVEEKNY